MRPLSRRVYDQPISTTTPPVHVSVWAVAGGWLARKLWRLTVLIVTTPAALVTVTALIAFGLLGHRFGPGPLLVSLSLLIMVGVVWRLRWPAGFLRCVRHPLRSWQRSWRVYRRRWVTAMDAGGLTHTRHGEEFSPALLRVRSTMAVDRVRLRMLPGQTIEDDAAVAPGLAQTFGAAVCRVRSIPGRVHELVLWLLIGDPLAQVVGLIAGDAGSSMADGLPIARAEDGSTWSQKIIGSHVLVVGATGAGKGSVLWSIIYQLGLCPVRAGAAVGDRPEGRDGTRCRPCTVRPVLPRRHQPS